MRRSSSIVLVLALVSLLVTGVMVATGNAGGRPLHATMTGPAEEPDGDPDGTGTATFTFNPGRGRVCFELHVENIAPATAAHIHPGGPGEVNPPIIGLTPPTDGSSSGCVNDVDPALIQDIKQNPGEYYVNVHNADFPQGAVRGQLER